MALKYIITADANVTTAVKTASQTRLPSSESDYVKNSTHTIVPFTGDTAPGGLSGTQYTDDTLATYLKNNRSDWKGSGNSDFTETVLGGITTLMIASSGTSNAFRCYVYLSNTDYDSTKTYELVGVTITNKTTGGIYRLGNVTLTNPSLVMGVRTFQTGTYNVTSSSGNGAAHNGSGNNTYTFDGVLYDGTRDFKFEELVSADRAMANVTK